MIQEEKDLLVKDLSARIPYKVKASYYGTDEEMECIDIIEGIIIENNDVEIIIGQYELPIEKVKLYLFPLSSMTEEQKEEYCNIQDRMLLSSQYKMTESHILFDWLDTRHFDYNGLIPKGLALDATGLNIY